MSKRRFRFDPSQFADAPARPPVTPYNPPPKLIGERRHVFTARPDGSHSVSWHQHEQTRLKTAVDNAVKSEYQKFKDNKTKP